MGYKLGISEVWRSKDINDYIFTVEVSNTDGSHVRRKNIAVSADNVEVAFDKVKDKVSKGNDIIRELISAEKL